MSYIDNLGIRNDEGLAFLSPHPISADYILLPRDSSDNNDFHRRICQHATVHVPGVDKVRSFE